MAIRTLMAEYLQDRLAHLDSSTLPDLADELERLADWIRLTDRLPQKLRDGLLALGPAPRTAGPSEPAAPTAPAPPLPDREDAGQEFCRSLRGGLLLPAHVRVPERIVRQLQLVSGDRLTYRALPNFGDGPPRYEFNVLSRGSGVELRERREQQLGVVELDGDSLVVRRFADGQTLDVPVVLPPEDGISLHLHDGSVVDLASWADAPHAVRVAWLHHLGPGDAEEALPASSPTKPKAKGPRVKREPPEPVLHGKRVLVVGNEPRQSQYAKAIELRGGQMEWTSGDDGDDRLAAALGRVDAALILKNHCSHHASESTTQLGKQLGIPVRRIGTDGIKSVADWAVTLITTPVDELDDDAG